MNKKQLAIGSLTFATITIGVLVWFFFSNHSPKADSVGSMLQNYPIEKSTITVWGRALLAGTNQPAAGFTAYIDSDSNVVQSDGTFIVTADNDNGSAYLYFEDQQRKRYRVKANGKDPHGQNVYFDQSQTVKADFLIEPDPDAPSTDSTPPPSPIAINIPDLKRLTRLTASGANRGIQVEFTGAPSNTAVGITGFRIERSTSQTSGFAEKARVAINSTGTYQYVDTSLANTTTGTYYYRVIALRNNDESQPSNVLAYSFSAVTPSPSPLVAAPTAPTNLRLTQNTDNVVTITFRDNAGTESGYAIRRRVADTTAAYDAVVNRDTTNPSSTGDIALTDTTRDPNDTTRYEYSVFAYRTGADNSATLTNTILLTGSRKPAAPTDLKATRVNDTKIKLDWRNNTSDNEGYELWRSTDNSTFTKAADVPDDNKYTNTGLKNNTRYYYKLRAYRTVRGVRVYSNYSNTDDAKT